MLVFYKHNTSKKPHLSSAHVFSMPIDEASNCGAQLQPSAAVSYAEVVCGNIQSQRESWYSCGLPATQSERLSGVWISRWSDSEPYHRQR